MTGPERRSFPVQEWRSPPRQERRGLHHHLALLVRAHDEEPHARLIARDERRGLCAVDARVAVPILIKHRAQELEPLQAAMPHERAPLAHAAGEGDCVHTAHRRRVGADVLADPVRVDRDREPAVLVAARGALLDLAHVLRAREPQRGPIPG